MGVYMSAMTTSTQARMTPPPTPCRPRAAISAGMDGATPQASDPIRNTTTPAITKGRRPNMSDSLPTMGTATVEVSR